MMSMMNDAADLFLELAGNKLCGRIPRDVSEWCKIGLIPCFNSVHKHNFVLVTSAVRRWIQIAVLATTAKQWKQISFQFNLEDSLLNLS